MLTGAEIRAILAGPVNLQFGQVSAATQAVNYFSVNNALGKPIHVLVDAKCHEHLNLSQSMSQVRPPFTWHAATEVHLLLYCLAAYPATG
jgi:hypothetical protein